MQLYTEQHKRNIQPIRSLIAVRALINLKSCVVLLPPLISDLSLLPFMEVTTQALSHSTQQHMKEERAKGQCDQCSQTLLTHGETVHIAGERYMYINFTSS